MIFRRYSPGPPLATLVDFLWFFADWDGAHSVEHVLPDGTFELVINLRDEPRKKFHPDDLNQYATYRRGWVSGAHSRYIVIDAVHGASMVGAHFRPGGAAALLGMPASEFQDQVVEFDSIWGGRTRQLREQLILALDPLAKFRCLEQFLLEQVKRTPRNEARRARVTWEASQLRQQSSSVSDLADELGISHKHLVAEFRHEIGLTPKLFSRIQRFQEVLAQIQSARPIQWADVACRCGYYDQSHFVNDFRAFSGVNPSAYLRFDCEDARFMAVG
jgi:AraC-like DNA-binding protein